MYQWLSEFYDAFFGSYGPVAAGIRETILRDVLPRVTTACDLCCGTGTTAIDFARRGMRVWAVDLSPAMCRAARAKAREHGLAVRVMRADMRYFRLPEPVGLVTCEFDALNHVPEKTDLPAVLRSVAGALTPGGWFFFDANNRLSLEKVWPMASFFERPGAVVMFHGGFDAARERGWTDIDFFLRQGNCWRRRREHVEEVCWTAEEMKGALAEAGFSRVKMWDAKRFFPDNPYIGAKHRTYYLARKRS